MSYQRDGSAMPQNEKPKKFFFFEGHPEKTYSFFTTEERMSGDNGSVPVTSSGLRKGSEN